MKKFTLTAVLLFAVSCMLWAQGITTSGNTGTYVPPPGRATILYEQLPAGTNAYTSQEFTDLPAYSCEGADDFIVPAGEVWTIETVTAFGGGWNGFVPSNVVNIVFYLDAGGVPGAVVQAYMGMDCTTEGVYPAANLVAGLPIPQPLPAGHYWLSVAEVAPFDGYGQWGRNVASSVMNTQCMWRNPGGEFGYGTAWQPGSVITYSACDWAFRLEGTIGSGVVPVSTWALVIGALLIAGFVVVRTAVRRG